MTENEKFVRDNWENAEYRRDHVGGHPLAFRFFANNALYELERYDSLHDLWSAAATFTRERLEQIRQVEEEIEEIREDCRFWADVYPDPRLVAVYKRIFAREQAALDELRRGMTKQD